jgi:predicted ribosome quality control (RQC) complex YloA/Tae2 family protein
VGDFAGGNLTTGDVNIDILNPGVAGETNTIRIGVTQTRTFIAGIFGTNVSGSTVVVNSDGQLGVAASSRRFKREIKAMEQASEAILALKPVTFHYKSDNTNTPQFGLIAEEVAEVNPHLVVRDENGAIYTVRYDAVNAMLLNEFLKEHAKVEEQNQKIRKQEATIAELKNGIKTLVARIDEQDAKIERVSDQIEMSSSASQMVVNDH